MSKFLDLISFLILLHYAWYLRLHSSKYSVEHWNKSNYVLSEMNPELAPSNLFQIYEGLNLTQFGWNCELNDLSYESSESSGPR